MKMKLLAMTFAVAFSVPANAARTINLQAQEVVHLTTGVAVQGTAQFFFDFYTPDPTAPSPEAPPYGFETYKLKHSSLTVDGVSFDTGFAFYDVEAEVFSGFTLSNVLGDTFVSYPRYTTNVSGVTSIFDLRSDTGKFTGAFRLGFGRSVPEPSIWAMMILGFGAVGGGIRRRQSLQPACSF